MKLHRSAAAKKAELHGLPHYVNSCWHATPIPSLRLGGDLFSPSAIGTALYEGDRLAGRQMVDVLNHFELDYATFGNHEFDIKESQFHQRMQEAKFT